MDEIRYGVIGTGMMGIEHIENIAEVDGARVTAVSDPDAVSLANGANNVGPSVATFADHRDLLEADVCDAVVLVSPNYTHHAVLGDLLASDLHVLTEKPMCISTEECLDVVAAAQARTALTWVGLEYRYMPPVSRLIDEVKSGAVGNVIWSASVNIASRSCTRSVSGTVSLATPAERWSRSAVTTST